MRKIKRILLFLALPWVLQGAVYDCFPFFNELELLKLRLAELNGCVDYFVLVESIETQRGDEKNLYFKENKALFEPYLSKIIHVEVNERHPEMSMWEREHYQRNCILRGLTGCSPSDIIIISDLDEIPRGSVIERIVKWLSHVNQPTPKKKNKGKKKHQKKDESPVVKVFSLQHDIYFYQLNRRTVTGETWGGGLWFGSVVTDYAHVQQYTPQYFRNRKNQYRQLWHAGWHFTWMGGKDKIRMKLASVVEGRDTEVSDQEVDHWIQSHVVCRVDETFPAYVRNNEDYLKSIGFIAEY